MHEQAAAFWGPRAFDEFTDNPLQWGPFQFRPFANYRFTYGNGLNANPGQQETTAINEITPGALIQSRHLTLSYAPTLKYYSNSAFEDSIEHSASASINYGLGDWAFVLSHAFSKTSSPLVETGTQTPQQNHFTVLSAHYQYSKAISLDLSLSQGIQLAEFYNNSITWSSMNWLNYHFSEKTLIGAGVGGGYVHQDLGFGVEGVSIARDLSTDSTYEQIQGRLGWNPTPKLNFNFNGGLEIRQFLRTSLEEVYPIMGASFGYTPWEPTSFTILANRSVGASVTEVQPSVNTTFSAGIRQRLLGKLHLDLFGSYDTSDYPGIEGVPITQRGRSDETFSASATLGTRILNRGSISLFYQHSENISSSEGLGFSSDQYGFQLGYSF